MHICHAHNLNEPLDVPKPFGIRVTLKPGDTFARLLGPGWNSTTGTTRVSSAIGRSPTWPASTCIRARAIDRRWYSSPSSRLAHRAPRPEQRGVTRLTRLEFL